MMQLSVRAIRFLPLWRCLFGVCCGIWFLGDAEGQTNLALGRTTYNFNRPPSAGSSYSPGDLTDLTDGIRWPGTSNYTSLIGWLERTSDPVISTRIDLGSSQKISSMTLGVIGVPAFVDAWVSDDNVNYRYAGEMVSQWLLSNTPVGSGSLGLRGSLNLNGRNDIRLENLRLQGRYVRFNTYRSASFLFVDEAEVWSGTQTALPSSITLNSGVDAWSISNKQGAVTRVRYLRDLQELSTHSMASSGTYSAQFTTLRQRVMDADRFTELNTNPTAGLGVSSVESDIWKLNGQMNKSAGQADHAIAPAVRYEPVHPFDTVTLNTSTQSLEMAMGERRPIAVNLSNNTTAPNKYADIVVHWPGGGSPPAGVIDMRSVRFTEAQEHVIVGSALPRAQQISSDTWRIPLPTGATSQIWMDVDSRSLSHGTYGMQIDVIPQGAGTMTLPVNLKVRRGRVQDNMLELHGFDYLNPGNPALPGSDVNRANLQDLLKDYGQRSSWMHPGPLMAEDRNFPRKADGSYDGTPSFATFKTWLDELQHHPQGNDKYYVALSADALTPQYYTGGIAPGDPRYTTALTSFFRALGNAIDEKGLDKNRFVMLVIDEPGPGSHPQEIEFTQIMKQAVPEFKPALTAGGNYNSLAAIDQPLVNAMDVIIANLNSTGDNEELWNFYRQATRGEGQSLQTYVASGGGQTRSPTNYFRRLAWEAEKRGLDAASFWASVRADVNNTWDDFAAESRYETVFAQTDSTEVTPSKMLSALRDGAEDYARFKTVRLTSNQVHDLGVTRSLGWWAKRVVKTEVTNALAALPGVNSDTSWQRSVGANSAFDGTAVLDALDAVDRFAPKPANRLDEGFGQSLSSQWTRYQPNVGGATNVTTVDLASGVLRAKQGELIRSVPTWNLNDGELTFTGQMVGQNANGANRLTLYNSDQSQSLDILYYDRTTSTDRVSIRRNIGAGSVTFSDVILPSRHDLNTSPQWMAVNIDKQNIEVSLLPHNQKRMSDFEGPSYTSAQSVHGQDGWTVLSGTGRLTPDPVSGYTSEFTLQGDRSLILSGTAKHGFDPATTLVDGSILSWRMRVEPGATAGFYLSDNLAGGSTPAGVEFANGTVKGFAASSSNPATNMLYEDGLEYLVSMELNFTADRFKIWLEDPEGHLFETTGNYNFYLPLTPAQVLDDGGIFLSSTGAAVFDDIQITSPVVGAPAYLVYSGPHGLTSGLDSVRLGIGNLGTGAGEEAIWDNLTISQLLNYTPSNLPGDANLDRRVDTLDFNVLAGNFGLGARIWTTGDFDHNGLTDSVDFNILAANYGRNQSLSLGAIVPEPAILAFAPILLLTFRRRWG
jgi:hypothetical protein